MDCAESGASAEARRFVRATSLPIDQDGAPYIAGGGGALSPGAGVSCIVRDKEEKSTLYLCNRHGILKSTDHGRSYRLVHECSPER